MPIIVNKEEKVKEICNKAFDEFTENGIESFSLNQFINNNQISKGQFYHYFKTKDDLIFEVMSQKTLEMMDSLDEFLDSANSLMEKLYLFFSVYIDDSEETLRYRKLMFDTFHLYTHSNNPKVKEFNKVVYEWADAKLIELFVKESKHGSIPDSLLPLVKSISVTADGMYLRSLFVTDYDLKFELTHYLGCLEKTLLKEIYE